MLDWLKSLRNKANTDSLMRGSGSCLDDIKQNGEMYQARVRAANAAMPGSEAYDGIVEPDICQRPL